jgi:hypothetical protein
MESVTQFNVDQIALDPGRRSSTEARGADWAKV